MTAPDGSLWIAKFPSKEDDFDTGAWEYLVHVLAEEAGVCVPAARAQKFSKTGTTFLCRRFDREGSRRIPFASAMTMLGCEDRQEDGNGTYIDMAGFLMQHGAMWPCVSAFPGESRKRCPCVLSADDNAIPPNFRVRFCRAVAV